VTAHSGAACAEVRFEAPINELAIAMLRKIPYQ
jgi:hypothetical protein